MKTIKRRVLAPILALCLKFMLGCFPLSQEREAEIIFLLAEYDRVKATWD